MYSDRMREKREREEDEKREEEIQKRRDAYEGERIEDSLADSEIRELAESLGFPAYYGGYWDPTEVRAFHFYTGEEYPLGQSNLETALEILQEIDERVSDNYVGGAYGRHRMLLVPLTDLDRDESPEEWELWLGDWDKYYRPSAREVAELPIGRAMIELVRLSQALEQHPVLDDEHFSELQYEQDWNYLEGELGHFCRLWENEYSERLEESDSFDPWDHLETQDVWQCLESLGSYRVSDIRFSDLEEEVVERISAIYREVTGRELPESTEDESPRE